MKKNRRVAIALSGGVDSSVAAFLLKDAGFEVVALTMHLWSCHKESARQSCCSLKDRIDARRVAEHLGINFAVVDLRERFQERVVDYFVAEYLKGRTPNPCILCNHLIKFEDLWKIAVEEYGCDFLATGHYARIEKGEAFSLWKGRDPLKDQSYFLFGMDQEQLSRTHFPLGEKRKTEIKELAKKLGLPTHDKKESQEVCFLADRSVTEFISERCPEKLPGPGNFVDGEGKILGRHEGAQGYTIGQRRGLRIGFGRRTYVTDIRAEVNEVVLGRDEELAASGLVASQMHWQSERARSWVESGTGPFQVKIRYAHPGVTCQIEWLDRNRVKVEFASPQRAVAPGQAAVIYRGEELLGGGWIEGAS